MAKEETVDGCRAEYSRILSNYWCWSPCNVLFLCMVWSFTNQQQDNKSNRKAVGKKWVAIVVQVRHWGSAISVCRSHRFLFCFFSFCVCLLQAIRPTDNITKARWRFSTMYILHIILVSVICQNTFAQTLPAPHLSM